MYCIVRMYQNDWCENRIIKRGLTLEEAQAHCRDPETSSSTATSQAAVKRTEAMGQWFDGYESE
jgi:hypothetical protein